MRRDVAEVITTAALEIIQAAIDSGTRKQIENLKPNDWLTVYHGTTTGDIFSLINGFDANTAMPRYYNAPRHKGLFVSPDPELAKRFGDTKIVLEIRVKARNLHGTDYGGNIGRERKKYDLAQEDWAKEQYPNSFRPYLSQTMLQKSEPQGLLRGLVKPNQITRIWVREKMEKPAGSWYTRKEFVNMGMKFLKRGGQWRDDKTEVKDLGVDLSYPGYSVDEVLKYTAQITNTKIDQVKQAFEWSAQSGNEDRISDLLTRIGWGATAVERYTKKIVQHFKKAA